MITQIDEITAQLIRGEITQEQALNRQREILGAEIPETTTTTAPEVSTETKVESAIAKYEAVKDAARHALVAVAQRSQEIESERQRLQGAIAAAESKSRILAGSPGTYRAEKADLIARGLLGEKVELASIKTEAEDFADNISAGDLALGIKALRGQLQDIERRKIGIEADKRRHSHEFFEAHARVHGIRFAWLASELAEHYAHIQAAHRGALSQGDRFSQLAPESLSNLQVNNPLPDEVMRECGVTRREWSGRAIEQTTAVQNAGNAMFAEMAGAA